MNAPPRRWNARRIAKVAAVLALAGFVGLNIVACRHARRMSHFTSAGDRTASPEKLSRTGKAWALVSGVSLPRPENRKTPAALGLDFETHKVRGARGLDIECWLVPRTNHRATVVLFHGYNGCKDSLLPVTKVLHELGCACVLVDFHGSGGSAGNTTSVGWHEARDVAAAFDLARERAGGKPVILFGSSMGAAAVLRAVAVHGVKPDALIIECPFDRMLTTTGNRFHAMGLPAFPFAHVLVFWGGVDQGFDGFAHNPVEYAREVRCPVLLLHGESDTRVKVAEVKSVFDALAGPKTLRLLPGVGHEFYVEVRPEEWRREVARFLESGTR